MEHLIEIALRMLDSEYPYAFNAANLRIEYLELFGLNDTHASITQMAWRMIRVARHPDVSWRSQPSKRAAQMLRMHRDFFEPSPGRVDRPYTWRLSAKGRRMLGVKWRPVNGASQKQLHWVGLGDIWVTLAFAGGRPGDWITEHYQIFDAMFTWQDRAYLMEYQRTPITEKKWVEKWRQRTEWYKKQKWDVRPTVILVNTTGQRDETIHLPRGTIHARTIDALPRLLTRPPQ